MAETKTCRENDENCVAQLPMSCQCNRIEHIFIRELFCYGQ